MHAVRVALRRQYNILQQQQHPRRLSTTSGSSSSGTATATPPPPPRAPPSSSSATTTPSAPPKPASAGGAAGHAAAAPGGAAGVEPGASGLRQQLSQLMHRPGQIARTMTQSMSDASASVYKHMPNQARQWVDAAGKPESLQRVLSLQAEAFWQHHGRKILLVGGAFTAYMLWRTLFGMAKVFINLSDTIAASGFMALAAACTLLGYQWVVRRYTINPNTVYKMALSRLNTNPAVLEVMGAPVAGSQLRASILTGGGLRVKNLVPKLRSRRLQMIFPLAGADRRGLVSVEAKKRKGKLQMKLLAVDVPSVSPGQPPQRLFLEGDESMYSRGGVLNELRDPFLRALSLRDTHEREDELDEEEEDRQAEQAARDKVAERALTAPKPLDQGGGMFFYERAYIGAKRTAMKAATWLGGGPKQQPPAAATAPDRGKVQQDGAKA